MSRTRARLAILLVLACGLAGCAGAALTPADGSDQGFGIEERSHGRP